MSVAQLHRAAPPVPNLAAPPRRRSWKRLAARFLLGGLFCYAGVLLVLLGLENRLLYSALSADAAWLGAPADVGVRDVALTAADGTRLHAWWSAPPGWKTDDGALLFCHGNGGNLSHRGGSLETLQRYLGTGVLLFDYPGYGRSGGVPTEAGCYAAGDAAYDWLTGARGVPAERVVLYGGSLGGGVAADLAARRPHRALVLVSTFTSFPEEAQCVVPWLPARWLVRNRFETLAKLASVRGPVFVAHSRTDGLIPFAMGERLFQAACGPKRFFAMADWRHNDVPTRDAFVALRAFLDATAPVAAE